MGKMNMDALKNRLDAAESGGNYSNTDYDKLQNGKNVRRILWPKGDRDVFYSEGFLHFSLGAEGKKVATCPKTFNEKNPCPICEYVAELQKSKSKQDKKLADQIKAKRRIYINVLSRDDEEETPKVLPIGVTILKGLLETICDPDYGDITDPEEGRDVTITRKGQGLNTEYSVLPKPKASVVSEELEVDDIEEQMADLDALFIEKSYDELQAILDGEDEDDNGSDGDDEEEDSGDDDDPGYDDMDIDELTKLVKKRKLKMPNKVTRLNLISVLTKADAAEEAAADEPEDDGDSGSEDDGEGDDVEDAIAAALAKRKGNKKK